ncbi:NAD(P)/FAD-dependent oxidoreductase [Lentibacter sp. XHP0401]|uniref:NAD(P)/FAD-dependent oxidoreductase n=1 Tax=Lentibacter sp. XHP0401 TaxID=2984334 RepID=UPI0021E79EAD|nr:FAD-dependent oxidoreductase [Lentibacter sp. XHP0401]MCV2894974.1 FAD-binding oxidoreductase [Lentibacter sp. XHP0401]
MISASGADMLICRKGFRHAYRDKQELTGAIARAERMAREYGVAFEPLDGRALQRAEPNLLIPLAGAIQWLDPWTCRDPEALVAAYTKLFKAAGGTVVSGDAMTLHARQGKWAVDIPGATGPMVARDAVICLGSQSAQLTTRFGLRVPLFCKRGYHLQLKSSRGPNLLLVDAKNSTVLAPMVSGLRILTGAELSRPSSAGTTSQLNHAIVSARELFEIEAPRDADPWMGNRPCMPDMLPVVGAVPGQSGLWANFGHGHQGFTLGPTTASLLAHEMAGNSATFPELSPCYRF